MVAHEDPEILARAGRQRAADVEEVLTRQLGLTLSAGKSFNLVISPGSLVGSAFSRGGNLSQSAKRELPGRENQLRRLSEEDELAGGPQRSVYTVAAAWDLP